MPIGFDPISAGIGVVGNIVGGIFGSRAANKAAKLQEQAAKGAAARTDQTTQQVNGDIIGAGNASAQQVRQAAGEGISRVDEATGNANRLLDPYAETGAQSTNLLTQGLAAGGDFNRTPTLQDIQIDPGYGFRAQQATKALEGSAAARGGVTAGGGRDVLALNSNLASQEYQNAFERFRNTTNDRFNRLNITAGRGADVAGQQGANLTGAGTFGANLNYGSAGQAANFNNNAALTAGQNSIQGTRDINELMTGGAAARAAGVVGGANALGGGIAGAANSVVSQRNLSNLLKNPTLLGPGGYGYNPGYSWNPLGNGQFGAGPERPPQ